jgi:hypothetical protein
VFLQAGHDRLVDSQDLSLTESLGRWKSMKLRLKKERKAKIGQKFENSLIQILSRFTVGYFVHHRSQRTKVGMTHRVLRWDPLFGFILFALPPDTEDTNKKKRVTIRYGNILKMCETIFLRRGTCSKGRGRRCRAAALGGWETGLEPDQNDTTRNPHCCECLANCPRSEYLERIGTKRSIIKTSL